MGILMGVLNDTRRWTMLTDHLECIKYQLKAVDITTFISPYGLRARIYFDKINANKIEKSLKEAQQ
ncbi:hypothetical protein OAU00_02150 [Saprospiraceae bacterium]|jgi:hypothetical protein|nr:hypothetical protein [Saprospiraceae bacterium]